MQIIETADGRALCQDHAGNAQWVDTLLVGDLPVNTWLLIFLGGAREVLSAEKARQISDALQAVNLAMQGEVQVDHLFADLVDREPELPEFLQQQLKKEKQQCPDQ